MACRRFFLAAAAIFAGIFPASAQEMSPGSKMSPDATPSTTATPVDNSQTARETEKLPPEKRKKEVKNPERMKDLPPEQRDLAKLLSDQRRKKLKEGVDEALAANGLKLTPEERAKFEDVYKKHRRDLEKQLRDEMDKHRAERLPGMVKEVVAEYQALPAGPPPPVPGLTPKAPASAPEATPAK